LTAWDVVKEGVPRLLVFESPELVPTLLLNLTPLVQKQVREGKRRKERKASPGHLDSGPIE
jgi:hypothetical protein